MRVPRFTPFDTRCAWQRLLAGGMTAPEAGALVTREILRAEELYRALVIQAGVFTAIVAIVIVAILLRL